jgi:nicotinate-nucleotide--dimethylbenzimidazole phosphoribosyltransferase
MTPTAPRTGAELAAVLHTAPGPDETSRAAAEARNGQLTKPPGALGRLEELAIWYCGWRGDATARIASPQVAVFAGNHGVTAQGVSAFPADVTAQMVANFNAGGAAINQLAEMAGARLDVVPIALDQPTADFTQGPAMDAAGFAEALAAGWNTVDPGADLLVTGEMGIGNTTSAAAIALALYGARRRTGPGGAPAWMTRALRPRRRPSRRGSRPTPMSWAIRWRSCAASAGGSLWRWRGRWLMRGRWASR